MTLAPFVQSDFNRFIIENDVIGFSETPFHLKSGRNSTWYVNWRRPTADAYLMDMLSDYIVSFISDKKLDPECIYGVPEGATKTGVIATFKWAKISQNFEPGSHPLAMGRAVPKEHGDPKDKFFVGAPTGRIVVLEDVTTTGGSLLKTLEMLSQMNANVIATLALTHRMELTDERKKVADVIREKFQVPYYAMSRATELLPLAAAQKHPPAATLKEVVEEFNKYGEETVSFS